MQTLHINAILSGRSLGPPAFFSLNVNSFKSSDRLSKSQTKNTHIDQTEIIKDLMRPTGLKLD